VSRTIGWAYYYKLSQIDQESDFVPGRGEFFGYYKTHLTPNSKDIIYKLKVVNKFQHSLGTED